MSTETKNIVNGVDVDGIVNTVKAVTADPEIAKFRFRATNRLVEGGLNRTEIKEFHGAKQEHRTDKDAFVLHNDEPHVLLSQDKAPNPVEYVLHALLGCMTTTTTYHAAAKGIEIESIRSEIEGDLDLQGFLGMDPDIRPGYQGIRAKLVVKTKGSHDEVAALHKLSPVYDIVSRPVPVQVDVVFE